MRRLRHVGKTRRAEFWHHSCRFMQVGFMQVGARRFHEELQTMKTLLAAACTLAAMSAAAAADSFPARPVTMIVPFGAGGPTDALARIVAERMRSSLGQAVLVENVTGASGTLGITRVARAAPDGYTIVL